MSGNNAATEASGERTSDQGIMESTESHSVATTNQSDSSSPHQPDQADTNPSTTPLVISPQAPPIPPPPPPPPPTFFSTLSRPTALTGASVGPTYGTQVGVNEASDIPSAYPPSYSIDAPRLPPLVTVQHPSQSQPNIRAQSATISPPVSPNASTPVTDIEVTPLHSSSQVRSFLAQGQESVAATPMNEPPSLTPHHYDTPLRQSFPRTPYPGTSSLPYRAQRSATPSSPPRPFVPQSAPRQTFGRPISPVSIREGTFIPPAPGSRPGYVPPPQPFSSSYIPPRPLTPTGYNPVFQPVKPQTIKKIDSFVASDPFELSYGGRKVDAALDGLTFDDIPTAEPAPGPKFPYGVVSSPYGALPMKPAFGTNASNSAPPPPSMYGRSHSFTQPEVYPSSSWGAPSQSQRPYTSPFIPPPSPIRRWGDDPLRQPYIPTQPLVVNSFHAPLPSNSLFGGNLSNPPPPLSEVYDQNHSSSQPRYNPPSYSSYFPQPVDSPNTPFIPSLSPVVEPISSETVTPVPAVPVDRPTPSPHAEHIPSTPFEPRTEIDIEHGPPVPAVPYVPYVPDVPHSQPQYPELPKKPFFARLARFFRWPHRTQPQTIPQPFAAMDSGTDWHEHEFMKAALKFILVTFPKQLYLNLLLRLPSLYFSRVARIFEEADMTLPEIKKMALDTASRGLKHEFEIEMAFESSNVPPAYKRLTSTWEFFIDSVMREWKILNIVSVLLLSAILTILQIQGAADDPLTRYTALFSLMCALMSLLYGCMYIIRFGTMRKTYKAAEWALEAKRTKTLIWWNVWVLLAMPAIWLTWSIILYIACIMSFVWRSGVASTTPAGMSDTGLLALRISMTIVLAIGMVYGYLIMTTFSRYGVVMDKAWKQRIDRWVEEKAMAQPAPDNLPHSSYGAYPDGSTMFQPTYPSYGSYPADGSTAYQRPMHPPPHGYYRADSSTPYQPPTQPFSYPDSPTMHRPTAYSSPPYQQPSFGDTKDGYAWNTDVPAYGSSAYVPPPKPISSPDSSTDTLTRTNTMINSSSKPRGDEGMPAWSRYIPSRETTPPPLPKGSVPSAEDIPPPRLIPKTRYLALPPRPLPLIPGTPSTPCTDQPSKDEDNVLGLSPTLENRVDDGDVPDNENQVRFQSPLETIITLADRDVDVESEAPSPLWEPSHDTLNNDQVAPEGS